ncbi:MAG: hypothetical protein ACOC23_09085, partial [Thermodesulfobacteriota bacterium]
YFRDPFIRVESQLHLPNIDIPIQDQSIFVRFRFPKEGIPDPEADGSQEEEGYKDANDSLFHGRPFR